MTYRVIGCAKCAHPGGQHHGGGCLLCVECDGFEDGPSVSWSDTQTRAMKQAMAERVIAAARTRGYRR